MQTELRIKLAKGSFVSVSCDKQSTGQAKLGLLKVRCEKNEQKVSTNLTRIKLIHLFRSLCQYISYKVINKSRIDVKFIRN